MRLSRFFRLAQKDPSFRVFQTFYGIGLHRENPVLEFIQPVNGCKARRGQRETLTKGRR